MDRVSMIGVWVVDLRVKRFFFFFCIFGVHASCPAGSFEHTVHAILEDKLPPHLQEPVAAPAAIATAPAQASTSAQFDRFLERTGRVDKKDAVQLKQAKQAAVWEQDEDEKAELQSFVRRFTEAAEYDDEYDDAFDSYISLDVGDDAAADALPARRKTQNMFGAQVCVDVVVERS